MTSTHRRLRPEAAIAEDGAAAVLLLLLTPALFGLAGLVLDGGTELAARQHAADLAEQAARGGADALDTNALRTTGTGGLDATAAQAAACRYVTTTDPDASCTATVTSTIAGQQVTVRVRGSHPTVLLGLIGINTLHTDAVGTAQAVTGIRTRLGHG
jgi:Flp pilus assembly protein TadG